MTIAAGGSSVFFPFGCPRGGIIRGGAGVGEPWLHPSPESFSPQSHKTFSPNDDNSFVLGALSEHCRGVGGCCGVLQVVLELD